jgi:hypothetical protein
MFLESGEETAAVDTMQFVWTGAWPANRSPQLEGAWLDGKTKNQSIHLKPGQTYPATVQAEDYNHKSLSYAWEVVPESTDLKIGGDFERRPESLSGLIQDTKQGGCVVKAPSQPGAYRLFAYVFNDRSHAAYVNIPFYVDQTKVASAVSAQAAVGDDQKK